MAAVIVALGYCIYTTTMDKRQKKKEQQADLQTNMRSDSEKGSTPSAQRAQDPKGESLRAKAVRKLHGKDANPSMLGDPVSLKAESSTHVPTDADAGSQATTLRGSEDGGASQNNETQDRGTNEVQDTEEKRSRRGSKL